MDQDNCTVGSSRALLSSMTSQELVNQFLARIDAKDLSGALSLCANDFRYENVPMAPIVGRQAAHDALRPLFDSCSSINWEVRRTMSDATSVANERIDRFTINGHDIALPVAGFFEVTNNEITLWRDYFDLDTYRTQMAAIPR
jgi:limonene-1,2-epoxide hydrolase